MNRQRIDRNEVSFVGLVLASSYQKEVRESTSAHFVRWRCWRVFRLNHYEETSLLVVVFTHLLRSNNPISRTRSTSHLADFFPISAAIIVPGDPKSCGISYSCAGLCSYTRSYFNGKWSTDKTTLPKTESPSICCVVDCWALETLGNTMMPMTKRAAHAAPKFLRFIFSTPFIFILERNHSDRWFVPLHVNVSRLPLTVGRTLSRAWQSIDDHGWNSVWWPHL